MLGDPVQPSLDALVGTIAEPRRAGEFTDAWDLSLEDTLASLQPLIADRKKRRTFEGIEQLVRDFVELGGRVACGPMEEKDAWFEPKEGCMVGVRASDIMIPICHAGQNRAQTARMVQIAVKQRLGCPAGTAAAPTWDEVGTGVGMEKTVAVPHGSIQAWDPYEAWKDLGDCSDMEIMCKYMPSPLNEEARNEDAFLDAFGAPKAQRVGHELAEGMDMMGAAFGGTASAADVESNRTSMHTWFSDHFFTPQPRFGDSRVVYFCFEKAGPVVLARAVEAARANGTRCDRMRVLMLPYGDHIKCGKGERSQQKYGLASHADAYVRTFNVIASLVVPVLEEALAAPRPPPAPPTDFTSERWFLALDKLEAVKSMEFDGLITADDYASVKERLLAQLVEE